MKNNCLSILTFVFVLISAFSMGKVDAKSMVYESETVKIPAWTRPPFMSSSQLRNLHNQLINARTPQEIAELLRKFHPRSININFQDKDGNTALHHAAAAGSEQRIRVLMTNQPCAEWRIKNNAGQTPVDLANRLGQSGQRLGTLIMELGKQCGMPPIVADPSKKEKPQYRKGIFKIPKN